MKTNTHYFKPEDINRPDAIEKLFCEPLDKFKRVPMSKEDTGYMVQMIIGKFKTLEEIFPGDELEQAPFLLQMMVKRMQAYTMIIKDARVYLWFCIMCKTPGLVVCYLTYLQWWAFKNNEREIDLDIVCQRIFPMGFFNEEDLHLLWDNTKVSDGISDNLLDRFQCLQSIQFKN